MCHNIHIDHLMSDARRAWQDPSAILERIGIKEGMKVVDLGCGPGFFTIPIASMVGEKGLVYAVDSDPDMLKHLGMMVENSGLNKEVIRVIQSDVSNTGIPAHSVDVVLFVRLLHDIEDKKSFFDEVKRISKPDANIVDVDWKKVSTEHGPPLHIRLNMEESEQILSENGFNLVKQIEAGTDHYGLVFQIADPGQ